MKAFEYYAPETLEEAIELLVRHGEGAYPLAGGTDLVTKTRFGGLSPKVVVNLKRIPGLAEITPDTNGGLRIGALVTLNQVALSPLIRQKYPMLSATAGKMASPLIRNLATIGGNLCNAAPSADTAQPLIALDADAVIVGPEGEHRVKLEQFFTGPGETVLKRGDLLKEVVLPPPDPSARSTYLKHTYRQAMDIAIVGVAVLVRFDPNNAVCQDARIVLGAVAPTPLRAREAEAVVVGAPLTEDRIVEAARKARQESRPIDDTYSSAWYRRQMVEVLTRRALQEVAGSREAQA
ncbi:MAG: xanthine dehydrogenase family protein subunit M [Chloroflexi bacterium]|nr:MAG: xanthine dehydrogenase family protein subunit M [Chloroflexota bacterium]